MSDQHLYDRIDSMEYQIEEYEKRIAELEGAIRKHKYDCDAHTYPADYDKNLYEVLGDA